MILLLYNKKTNLKISSLNRNLFMVSNSSLPCLAVCICVVVTNMFSANRAPIFQVTVSKEMDCCQVGGQSFLVTAGAQSFLLWFKTPAGQYRTILNSCCFSLWVMSGGQTCTIQIIFGSPDMKNFQQLLKRAADDERSKDSTERNDRDNRDAFRGETPYRRHPAMIETTTKNYQVSHSIILTFEVLVKYKSLKKKLKCLSLLCVCSSTAVCHSSRAFFRITRGSPPTRKPF